MSRYLEPFTSAKPNEAEIRKNAQNARTLSENRATLLKEMPFGKELERTRYDLGRIAVPVVAVIGSFSSGKSSLINALCSADMLPTSPIPTTLVPVQLRGAATASYLIGTAAGEVSVPSLNAIKEQITDKNSPAKYAVIESPQANRLPWQWLDTPGTNLQSSKEVDIALLPGELADLCVVVTPATQPLSLSDLHQVVQLRDYFPGDRMCIALTRCDQITPQEQISIRQHMDILLRQGLRP